MTIQQLIEKYTANRDYYLTSKYNETLLRSDFLDPFFELLGWDIKNNSGKPTNEREVILEEALKANASEHSKKPDFLPQLNMVKNNSFKTPISSLGLFEQIERIKKLM